MKKKLAALDMRIQIGAVVVFLLILGFVGHSLVVSPQGKEAAKIQKEITKTQTQTYKRRAEVQAGLHPPTIQVADLFKLARAMPSTEDMPGIILTLNQVAQAAGIKFDLIEPALGTAPPATGSFQIERIHLVFNGDFYGLSDFLYRLRSLVGVHDGQLDADGRLFNVDTVTFNVNGDSFPQISAELYVDAYIYGAAPVVAPILAPPTTTSSSDSTDSTDGATAAGATG